MQDEPEYTANTTTERIERSLHEGCRWPDLTWEELGHLEDRQIHQFYAKSWGKAPETA